MTTFRILAIDGGGIRGLLTTTLLRRLLEQPGLDRVFDSVNLFAGTSSGGLIALAMAHGLGAASMRETIRRTHALFARGRETFGPGLPWWLGGKLIWSKYHNRARERSLRRLVGDDVLGDLRRRVLVAAFDLDDPHPTDGRGRRWKPKLFHNLSDTGDDCHEPVWKVALATTAAPAFFPMAGRLVDGGVYSNNPSMCALAQVYDRRYPPRPKPPLRNILLLSVGAGQNLKFIDRRSRPWGALRWGAKYVELTMDGTVGIADYQVEHLLGPTRYRRLQCTFAPGTYFPIDDLRPASLRRLEAAAMDVDIRACAEWLRTAWVPEVPESPSIGDLRHTAAVTGVTDAWAAADIP